MCLIDQSQEDGMEYASCYLDEEITIIGYRIGIKYILLTRFIVTRLHPIALIQLHTT